MAFDFSITVEGLDVRPLSCQISFGVNQIPVAMVGIDPTVGDVLQKMEQYRRTQCKIVVKTVNSEIEFPCLFDGISFGMSPGGVSYTAVFKGLFQTWLEIFPYVPGFHPAGVNPYIRQSLMSVVGGNQVDPTNAASLSAAIGMTSVAKDNLAKALLNGITAMVRNQANLNIGAEVDSTTGTANVLISSILPKLASTSNPAYAKALNVANSLTSLVDTTAVDDFVIESAHVNELQFLSNLLLANPGGSLWELMLDGFASLGMVVVPGPTKMYVIPESYFMKPGGTRVVPAQKQLVKQPNYASPGYYNSISLSDNGYQDIGAVILSANPYMSSDIGTDRQFVPFSIYGSASDVPLSYGSYPAADAIENSNINGAIINVPASAMANLYCTYFPADKTGMENFKSGTSFKEKTTAADVASAEQLNSERRRQISDGQKKVLDNLAQMEFLKRKYFDRTGSINMLYQPTWVPGTTGTAFSRYPEPGVFVDFYVQQVTHVFDNSGGAGTAVTNVSFCSGRMGADPVGVDVNELYGYTVAKMVQIQNRFLADF